MTILQIELENLNNATDDINKLEIELDVSIDVIENINYSIHL